MEGNEKRKIHSTRILRVFWEDAKPYKWVMFLLMGMLIVNQLISVYIPLQYKALVDLLSSRTTDQSLDPIIDVLLIVLGLNFLGWFLWRATDIITSWFQPMVMARLQRRAHAHIHKQSSGFFGREFSGSLVRRAKRLSDSFEVIHDVLQYDITMLVVLLIGYLSVLTWRQPEIGLVFLIWVILFIGFNLFASKWKMKYDAKEAEVDSETTGVLADGITNAQSVKLFTGTKDEQRRFFNVTEKQRKARMKAWMVGVGIDSFQFFLMVVVEVVLMYMVVKSWQRGQLTVGDFVLVQSYMFGLFGTLLNFSRSLRRWYRSLADAEEMVELLHTEPEIQDASDAEPLTANVGHVQFRDVTFCFVGRQRVFDQFNLKINAGEKVGLVGLSGAGKTTLVKLLLRLHELDAGSILIDGQDISKVTIESLRRAIAKVPQDPMLFHRTILENIRYGRPEATNAEVEEAARKARCHDFIVNELPDGYGTYVGERGIQLSGGQRQRIAIARAILKDAPILVLDEATSSLDSESEMLIQEALEDLMEGRTSIVIAHRLSTVVNMDRIVVMENGQVIDAGTHDDLLSRENGTYSKLWEIQVGSHQALQPTGS